MPTTVVLFVIFALYSVRSFNSEGFAGGRRWRMLKSLFFFSLVQYKKPKEILTMEQELLKELKKLKGTGEGDVDCKTQ